MKRTSLPLHRRDFIAGLGSAAAWAVTARAQQSTVPVIGYLNSSALSDSRRATLVAFHRGLAEVGYVEGRNVAIEYRWAEDRYDRLPGLAADLVRRQVAVITTLTNAPAALAAKAATQTIPIVFYTGVDPVEYGLVSSLARPGGNMTGFTALANEVSAKRVELLHELAPAATSIALLFNPTNPANESKEVQNAVRALGLRAVVADASRQSDIEPAFAKMAEQRVGGLVVSADPALFDSYGKIAALAVRYGIPSIFIARDAVKQGGLLSYGANILDLHRQVGVYAGRILKGANPSDLPVQQPTKFEMAINLKTATTLGLSVPLTLQAQADEVIE